jgi:hypothetical protein
MEALAQAGFALVEDHMRVWRPAGRMLARGPVVTWAPFARAQLSSRFLQGSRVGLHGLDVARVAVHPGDVTVPELLASIRATYASFASRRAWGAMRILLRDPFMLLQPRSAQREHNPLPTGNMAKPAKGRDE